MQWQIFTCRTLNVSSGVIIPGDPDLEPPHPEFEKTEDVVALALLPDPPSSLQP